MYKAIIFDFFGVLSGDMYIDWLNKNNLGHMIPELKERYFKKSDLEIISSSDLHKYLAEFVNRPVEGVILEIKGYLIVNEKVLSIIKSLKTKYKIVLCSNAPAGLVEEFLKESGLEYLFNEIVISSAIGTRKPEKEIFIKTLNLLDVGAEDVIFIDDTQENIESAQSLGIKSFLFKDSDILEAELSECLS